MTSCYLGVFDSPGLPLDDLPARGARALSRLASLDDSAVLAALADPRPLHRALYYDLAPADRPELAGNYRGSEYPSLKFCTVFSAFNESEGTTSIVLPQQVEPSMRGYARLLQETGLRRDAGRRDRLAQTARIMALFGVIHPFIDGNGHIQRLTVQCLLERSGFRMTPSWRVHPCPYDEDFHRALASCDVDRVADRLKTFVT